MTENKSLIEQLQQFFGAKVLEPLGEVIAVPERILQKDWEQRLRQEGYTIFHQDYSGSAYAFILLRKPQKKTT